MVSAHQRTHVQSPAVFYCLFSDVLAGIKKDAECETFISASSIHCGTCNYELIQSQFIRKTLHACGFL